MRIFLVAGEPSGDKLGAALMAGLKSIENVEFQGVGGPLMMAEGMQSLFPMEELSVMGLTEVLPKYLHLRRRLHQTAEAVSGGQAGCADHHRQPGFLPAGGQAGQGKKLNQNSALCGAVGLGVAARTGR